MKIKKMKCKYNQLILMIGIGLLLANCGNDTVPKPKAYLRLEYPDAKYDKEDIAKMPFTFDRNALGEEMRTKTLKAETTSYGVTIDYPKLKGSIYLTYKGIENDPKHLNTFLRDAQNFTQEHTQKADEIIEQPYVNDERKVYGMFYEVGGNAASQSQFYVTDSINHFLVGSLYFDTNPNYDSILPAAHYLQKDIQQIMESVKWKDKKR